MKDKYSAVWVSHSSIADFLTCPRLYYLRNVYKNPKTGHKMTIMTPPLALGQVVHGTIDKISRLPRNERMQKPLKQIFESMWKEVSGKKGGFLSPDEEDRFFQRGKKMVDYLDNNPGLLVNKTIKLKSDNGLPYYWLSDEDNIILCGKIDWIEYLEDSDSIHIIDFKSGKNEEKEDSLQLPIYYLLAKKLQSRPIVKASFWYLEDGKGLVEKPLPDYNRSLESVLKIAKRMKLGRQIDYFKCPKGGCFACRPLERILAGEGELVAVSEYNQDIFILP